MRAGYSVSFVPEMYRPSSSHHYRQQHHHHVHHRQATYETFALMSMNSMSGCYIVSFESVIYMSLASY